MKNKLPVEKIFNDAEDCFSAMIKHIKQFGGKFECQDNPQGKNPKFGWIHKQTNKWFLISSKDFRNSLDKMPKTKSALIKRAISTQEGKLALVAAINGAGSK
jgi:hypothetical protein